jgi:hypothetical protein
MLMLFDQHFQRFRADEGRIPAKDQRLTGKPGQMLPAAHHCVPGPLLLGLLDKLNIRSTLIPLNDLLFAIADHDDVPLYPRLPAGIQHPLQHRPTAHFVQHLSRLGVHSGTLTRC